jgi:hypothetical protein
MQEKVSKICGITASKWRMPRISTEIGNKTMVVGFFSLSMKLFYQVRLFLIMAANQPLKITKTEPAKFLYSP